MNKWGVRFIASLFLLSSISDVYDLITGSKTNLLFLVSAAFWAYIGVQLFRFQPGGRDWALVYFLLAMVIVGVLCLWTVTLSVQALGTGTSFPYKLHPKWGGEISDPIIISAINIGIFLFCLIPVYFLMRKDVKILFQKAEALKEKSVDPDVPSSSDQTTIKR